LTWAATASAAPVVDGHFPLASPVDTNSKIVAGPDGNMWLAVHGANNDVARVTPAGKVDEFELEGIDEPSGIAVGPEKKLWVTAINKVASFSPSDPKGTSKAFTIPAVTSNNPIVAGPDGQMWDAATENLVHFKPSEPEKAEAIFVAGLSPRDIDVAGSLLVVADAGKPRIVTMTTAGVEQDFAIGYVKGGIPEGASQGVAGSPSGQIGFSQPGAAPEQIGLITPPNAAQSFDRDGDPFGVALGSDGAFWIALSGPPAGVQRLTPTGGSTFLGGFPAGFTPRQIAAGPGNTIWVTIEKPGLEWQVVRISGLEPPVEPISKKTAPQTKIAKGPKKKVKTKGRFAKVTFRFNSTTAGARFECALTKAKKGTRGRKPKFKSCKSPKSYKLKPGRYKFSVRAVSGGVADPTPATRSFRVIHIG
jgi:streptogramin lyase